MTTKKNDKTLSDIEKLDKEIEDLLAENNKKREDIAAEELSTAQRVALDAKKLQLQQLKTESARLDLALSEATRVNSAEAIQAGTNAPLAAARLEMEALQARVAASTVTTETAVTVTEPEQLESDTKEK